MSCIKKRRENSFFYQAAKRAFAKLPPKSFKDRLQRSSEYGEGEHRDDDALVGGPKKP